MPKQQIIVHLDDELHTAVRQWSDDEERSMSAQVRKVLRESIPVKYLAQADKLHVHDFATNPTLRFCLCGENNPVAAAV